MAIRSISDDFVPYTSINAVRTVFERCRAGKLPDRLTEQALQQIGVNLSMVSPTLRTLLFLGLTDEEGNATAALTQIKKVPTEEYPAALADIVRRAYIKVFTVADPADGEERITNAFRGFEPSNQRGKMIRLFMGLCEDAGIIAQGTTRKRTSSPSAKAAPRPRQTVPVNGSMDAGEAIFPPPIAKISQMASKLAAEAASCEVIKILMAGQFGDDVEITVTIKPGSSHLKKDDRTALQDALDALAEHRRPTPRIENGSVDRDA